MKKIFFLMLVLLIFPGAIYAEENNNIRNASYINCTSDENIWLSIDNKDTRISLIAYKKDTGSLDNEINNYICSSLKNAKSIKIEADEFDNDQYNRLLSWVYIDGELLQTKLVKLGYGQVSNVTKNYLILDSLCYDQKNAIINKLGVWNYSDIKEDFCNSGISIDGKEFEKTEVKKEKKSIDSSYLKYIIVISVGILILLLVLRGKKNNE